MAAGAVSAQLARRERRGRRGGGRTETAERTAVLRRLKMKWSLFRWATSTSLGGGEPIIASDKERAVAQAEIARAVLGARFLRWARL